jgi:hypothetical protein
MDDGKELLAFFPLPDRSNWVAWTPDGFYAATPGAQGVLRWHVNHGWDAPGEAIPVSDITELHRPEVLPLALQQMDMDAGSRARRAGQGPARGPGADQQRRRARGAAARAGHRGRRLQRGAREAAPA